MVNPHEALLAAVDSQKHVFLHGPNFSGRTAALQHISRVPASLGELEGSDSYGNILPLLAPALNGDRYAYVGPEIYQSLSGLAANVRSELLLHSFRSRSEMEQMAELLGLASLFGQGCFELSGGQQAILVGAAAALLQPKILALDCCLEQLDSSRRDILLKLIAEVAPETSIVLADNEITELSSLPGTHSVYLNASQGRAPFPSMDIAGCLDCLPPRSEPPALELRGVSFGYTRSSHVLSEVELRLQPGQIYWLRGANGSGKTTLAKLLAGVQRPSKGEILVAGQRVHPHRSPGCLVAYHFQNPDLQLFSTTVWSEVLAGPRALGCSEEEASRRAGRALSQLAIPDDFRGAHPLDLPFALRKRLALAATISAGTPWIILDEPSLAQDAGNTTAIRFLLTGLAQAGMGVIVISHSRLLTGNLCDHIVTLSDGHATAESVTGINGLG